MATISRTGITAGGTISPTHITNIIDALDGTGVGITVVATGSFSGSLVGNATTATTATTASYALTATSASFAPATFPYTGSARISGSLQVTGSVDILGNVTISGSSATGISMYTNKLDGSLTAQPTLIVNFTNIANSGAAGKFVVPAYAAVSPTAGTLYWDDANSVLYIYQSSGGGGWRSVLLS
jgi:hypothetical protein